MDRRTRVRTTLKHRKPDKVPKGEIGEDGIDPSVIQALLGENFDSSTGFEADFRNNLNARKLLDMDLVAWRLNELDYDTGRMDDFGNRIFRDFWGAEIVYFGPQNVKTVIKPVFSQIDDVWSYSFPSLNPEEGLHARKIQRWVTETDFYIFGLCMGVFFLGYFEFFKFDKFMEYCITEQKAISYWAEKTYEFCTEYMMKQIEEGANGIIIADDLAYNTGTFASPTILEKIFFPLQQKQVEVLREKDVPVILHSDGNIMSLIPRIVDMGFDGIHAIQPSAGMDIGVLKRLYGKRLSFMGNLDVDLLGRGTSVDVERETKRIIDIAAPGGGFILSTSNCIGAESSVENVLVMYRTAEKWGKYREKEVMSE